MTRTTWRTCAEPGCPELIDRKSGKCETHDREVRRRQDAARPSSTARGYDEAHRRLRREWQERIDYGTVRCARCGGPLLPGQPWDLGHDDADRTRHTGPEHERCNRATKTHAAARRTARDASADGRE